MNIYGIMTTRTYELKDGTSTVWIETDKEVKNIDQEQYNNITDKNTMKFFRRLGGSEYASKGYTSKGYKIVELISKNPDRTIKKVRSFNLNLDYQGNKL